MNAAKLAAWVRATSSARKVAAWSLRQLLALQGREEQGPVATFDADEAADEIAAAAVRAAHDDADEVGGLCKYALVALDADERPIARKVWRVHGETLTEEAAPAEPADARGLLSQLMRHMEQRERILTTMVGELATHNAQARTADRQRIAELEGREVANVRLMADLLNAKARGEIEAERERFGIEMKRKAADKLATLVPVLAAKLTGQPLLPAGRDGDALRSLVISLKPEQIEGVAAQLDDAQRAAFFEIWAEAAKSRGFDPEAKDTPTATAAATDAPTAATAAE